MPKAKGLSPTAIVHTANQAMWNDRDAREFVISRLEAAYRRGATRAIAALYAGIGEPTLKRWMSIGQREIERRESGAEPDRTVEDYVSLVRRLTQARGSNAFDMLGVVEAQAQSGSLPAATWILERRHGYNKAPTQSVKHGGSVRVQHETIEPLSDDKLRDILPTAASDD